MSSRIESHDRGNHMDVCMGPRTQACTQARTHVDHTQAGYNGSLVQYDARNSYSQYTDCGQLELYHAWLPAS